MKSSVFIARGFSSNSARPSIATKTYLGSTTYTTIFCNVNVFAVSRNTKTIYWKGRVGIEMGGYLGVFTAKIVKYND